MQVTRFNGVVLRAYSSYRFVGSIGIAALVGSVLIGPVAAHGASVVNHDATAAASDEQGALALAKASGEPVVVDSLTTATDTVSALPDGTMELVTTSSPTRVDKGGVWVDIDTQLARSGGYFVPESTSVPVRFSDGGDSTIAQVRTETGDWVSQEWPHGALPAPTVEDNTALYENVLPGIDLQLTANDNGMSEVFVVHSAEALANPAFESLELGIGGATLAQLEGGMSIATTETGGTLLGSVPIWWDSTEEDSGPDGPGEVAALQVVDHEVETEKLSFDTTSIAESPDLDYPLFVDPTLSWGETHEWYIDSAFPEVSYLDNASLSAELRVGYISSAYSGTGFNHKARAFWQMPNSGFKGKNIIKATLNTTETHSFNCTASAVEVWRISGSGYTWDTSNWSWNHKQDTKTVAKGYGPACPDGAVGFNVTEAVTTSAANLSATNIKFGMRASSETSSTGWKRFSRDASLTVQFNSTPLVPVLSLGSPERACGTAASPAFVNSTAGVGVRVINGDPDDGASLQAHVSVAPVDDIGNPLPYLGTFQAEGPQPVVVPAADLVEGVTYAYWARTYDTRDYSLSSGMCYFTVDNTAPSLPSQIVPAVQDPLFVGQAFDAQFDSIDAEDVYAFGYWWVPLAATSTSPAFPDVSDTLPACGTARGEVWYVCADSVGLSPEVVVAPIDSSLSTLWVASIDRAGNVSTDNLGSSASPRQIASSASPAFDFTVGHGWITDDQPSATTTLVDSNVTTSPGVAAGSSLTLRTGAGMVTADLGGLTVPVVSFSGTAATPKANASTTSTQVVNTSKSFTTSVWLNRADTGTDTGTFYALSMAGSSSYSAFSTRLVNKHWEFCVTPQGTGGVETCARHAGDAQLGWAHVIGIWDASNQQVRIIVDGVYGSAVTQGVIVPAGSTDAAGSLILGSAISGANSVSRWQGTLANPSVYPGVINSSRTGLLYACHTIC